MANHKLQGAEIFSVGTHNGLDFTDSDLDTIVQAFDALGSSSRIPLKFGHNEHQPFTDGQPALGWVERIWKDGGKLFADFTGLPEIVFSAIKSGLYKHVSVELLQNFNRSGASFPWVLDAVALLGADIPAVRGLKDLQALTMTRALPGVRFARAVAFTQASHYGVNTDMTNEEIAALKKRAEDAEATLESERKAVFAEKVAERRKHILATLEAAVKEGRIEPRVRERMERARTFKDDQDVLAVWTDEALKAEIADNTKASFTEKKGPTSMTTTADDTTLVGKPVAEVVTFRSQAECVRLGQNPLNSEHLAAATKRIFASDKKLARAYFNDPHGAYSPDAA